jgi:hypothetical protein
MKIATKPHSRTIEDRTIGVLKPYAGNPRKHSAQQLKKIEQSIARF